jgi:hypothetical protein
MFTIQTLENIKRGSRITFINGIYAILIGISYILLMIPILKRNFRAIDVVWQVFSKYNPQLSNIILQMMILKGIMMIAFGIVIIYLSSYILKRKDKAAWIILFIIGLMVWASLMIIEIFTKNPYVIIANFIGWITFIIGMLIPIKYYLQKEYPEY